MATYWSIHEGIITVGELNVEAVWCTTIVHLPIKHSGVAFVMFGMQRGSGKIFMVGARIGCQVGRLECYGKLDRNVQKVSCSAEHYNLVDRKVAK